MCTQIVDPIQYEWILETETSRAVDPIFTLAKSRLPIALEVKFAEFANAIVDTHGKDLTVSTEPSRTGTPVGTAAASTSTMNAAASTSSTTPATKTTKTVDAKRSPSTTSVTVEANYMASASDLFKTLTDEMEIRRWAGGDAQVGLEVSLHKSALTSSTFHSP